MADSLGIGAMPDAHLFKPVPGGDIGANTLAAIIRSNNGLQCPTLQKLGLSNILANSHITNESKLWPPVQQPLASYGKMAERSVGKDTPSGHWEMAGVPLTYHMPVYYDGLPEELLNQFVNRCQENGIPLVGVLGGEPASGTEIIKKLGEDSVKSGKPIVYTSGDSVFQIAAHEESFGLQKLYQICEVARALLDELPEKIGRVIARPFIGSGRDSFVRTSNRKDYSLLPPRATILDACKAAKYEVISIGKIADIFAHQGFTQEIKSKNNSEGMKILSKLACKNDWSGVAFVNLVDFDMLYGHRRDPLGYAKALEDFDAALDLFMNNLTPNDLMIISADHGCDPTFVGTDHTREYVPVLCYQKDRNGKDLGTRDTFADVAATIAEFLQVEYACEAKSLLD